MSTSGRRIRTQEEADYWNARITGVVFVVSTPELEWMEFCQLWPRVAEWARICPQIEKR